MQLSGRLISGVAWKRRRIQTHQKRLSLQEGVKEARTERMEYASEWRKHEDYQSKRL